MNMTLIKKNFNKPDETHSPPHMKADPSRLGI